MSVLDVGPTGRETVLRTSSGPGRGRRAGTKRREARTLSTVGLPTIPVASAREGGVIIRLLREGRPQVQRLTARSLRHYDGVSFMTRRPLGFLIYPTLPFLSHCSTFSGL